MRTLGDVRKAFEDHGVCVSTWARDRGFTPRQVHDVLLGRAKGKRGVSHDVAVALGIKEGISGDDPRQWGRKVDAESRRSKTDAR
ncbi:helix-turn-helix domain-containing protein [Chitinimonas naiadis]